MMTKELRVCFVGVGSIAKRHIRNLKAITEERGIRCSIDVFRSGKGAPLPPETAGLVDRTFSSMEEVSGGYDAVFVTNPTARHFDALRDFQDLTEAFFIEKPVFQSAKIDKQALSLEGKCCYVACPLRYTGVIQYLKEHISPAEVRSLRVVSASYLPEWRPGTDYRKTYSASKELGGGVSIDLIHEWDYITYLLGLPVSVKSLIRKVSSLEINSDDIAVYIADYENCLVELHLDYFTRETIRRIEITTEEGLITADLVGQTIRYPGNRVLSFDSERDSFQRRELEYFLDVLEGKEENTNDLEHALRVLAIAEGN